MKIKKNTILAVLIYMLTFFSTTYFNYNLLKYALIIIVGVLLISDFNGRIFHENRKINYIIICFCCIVVIFSFVNRGNLERNPFLASVVFVGILLEYIFVLEKFSYMGKMNLLIEVFYKMTLIVVVVTDVLAVVGNSVYSHGGNYFIGTKFQVAYLHFFLIAFFMAYKGDILKESTKEAYVNKIKIFFYVALTWGIALKTSTATGVVGTIVLLIFLYISYKKINLLLNAKTFCIFILLSILFVWFFEKVLSNQFITYIITQLLDKDITLSLRTMIYSRIPHIMDEHWLMGYGFGSSYEVLMKYGIVDTQNGILEWIEQVGIIGVIVLISWLSLAMKKLNTFYEKKILMQCAPLVALVYVFLFLGTIEITLTIEVFALILIIYGLKNEKGE